MPRTFSKINVGNITAFDVEKQGDFATEVVAEVTVLIISIGFRAEFYYPFQKHGILIYC
jgi:hypothetical protein